MTKIDICGHSWKIFLLDSDDFLKRFKEELAGFADIKTRQIFINESDLDRITVRHELVHAYYSYTCTTAASLNEDQVEEVFCELFAIYGDLIIKQADHIIRELRGTE